MVDMLCLKCVNDEYVFDNRLINICNLLFCEYELSKSAAFVAGFYSGQ